MVVRRHLEIYLIRNICKTFLDTLLGPDPRAKIADFLVEFYRWHSYLRRGVM